MKPRVSYLDQLRVFSAFAVILLHISAQHWYSIDCRSFEWLVLNFYDSIVRWCVPVFLMISGALFLRREISLITLYCNKILRIMTAYIAWSTVYALVKGGSISTLVYHIVFGEYHMWFLRMIVGIYICIPIAYKIAESPQTTRYFLFLSFILYFFLPQVAQLLQDFGPGSISLYANKFARLPDWLSQNHILSLLPKYTFYFIGGFYLSNLNLSVRARHFVYFLGIIGAVATMSLTYFCSVKNLTPAPSYYDYCTINVLFESLAVFTWFKYNASSRPRLQGLIRLLAQYSFGAYLVHILVIQYLDLVFGFNSLSFNPVFSIPMTGIIVFIISFIISAIISRIPVLNKYIV